jgi:spermidine synthase
VKGPSPHRLLCVLFFASGACALVYEHLYQKLLGRTLGTSSSGTAAVLAAYMGGLGLGSLIGARVARRVIRPWRAYAIVEVGAALAALLVPRMLGAVTTLYVALAGGRAGATLYVTRFVIAAAVTVAPAVIAGMTFPLGARILETASPDRATTGRRLGALYGWNTLGAALGVLVSTYVLLPRLGTSLTLLSAAGCNLAIAALAWWYARGATHAGEPPATVEEPAGRHLPLATTLWGAFLSGVLGLALEVVWFRLLAVVIGASVFAFGLMLFAFLVGTGLGGAWVSRGRLGRAGPGALVMLQLLATAVILASLPLWDRVPAVFVVAGRLQPGFATAEAVRLLCALVLLLPPTVVLGAAFPLLFRLGHPRDTAAGRVARLYAVDTAGAVVGALGASFVLLPLAGARGALIVLALISAALAALYAQASGLLKRALPALVAVPLVCALMPGWNFARLNSGANAYFTEGFRDYDRLLYAHEDAATGLVTVVEKAGTRTLLTNGKFEGNDSFEVRDNYLFSLLPLLFVHRFDAGMNIGVGTGATLRVMAAFPFAKLEAVDLSSSVLRAARDWFAKVNGGALDDPRVEVIVEDGRNRLLASRRRYDLISIELSSIWIGGTGELYNREFYALARDRLAEGGVLQQWLQIHHISRRDLVTVIATMRSVFPHVTLWISGHQGVVIASMQPLTADPAGLARAGSLIAQSGLSHPLAALGHLYLATDDIDRLTADTAADEGIGAEQLISSDEHPRLEYSTPRGNLLPRAFADNMALIRRYAMTRLQPLLPGAPPALLDAASAYAALERGFVSIARTHAARAGAVLDAPEHRALRDQLAKDAP